MSLLFPCMEPTGDLQIADGSGNFRRSQLRVGQPTRSRMLVACILRILRTCEGRWERRRRGGGGGGDKGSTHIDSRPLGSGYIEEKLDKSVGAKDWDSLRGLHV